jgi:uncharacterized membrane protein YdbT with pleckstrin-like domain
MKRLDPKAVWLFFISFVLKSFFIVLFFPVWAFLILGDIAGNKEVYIFDFLVWYWVIVPVFIVICYAWARLSNYYYRYELAESGFRKESGVIYKRYVTVPYDRIQNVDIHRGIWARILGLSDLQVQTAGASASVSRYGAMGLSAEGRLPGLSKEVAEQLRDELVERARHSRNQGL